MRIGPFLSKSTLETAKERLLALGYRPEQTTGRGPVPMIRLLEGVYPAEEARRQLATFKKTVRSAFILPQGEQWALYAGSFYAPERAERLRRTLAAKACSNRSSSPNGNRLCASSRWPIWCRK